MNDNKALDMVSERMSTDSLELYCRNLSKAKNDLTKYDRALLMDVSDRQCELQSALDQAEPPNDPLTLEELREMDGEPVYIVERPDWGHWELSEDAEDYIDDRDEDFYGMTMPPTLPDPMGRYGLHVLGWLAYRRKPERSRW